jgi:hypothetical protein
MFYEELIVLEVQTKAVLRLMKAKLLSGCRRNHFERKLTSSNKKLHHP